MDNKEANELRLIANEIMRKLYISGQREQLQILRMYADRAIEKLLSKEPT